MLDWNAFRQQVQEQILYTEVFPHICGTCSWYSICSRKEAAAISQAFLQKQILPKIYNPIKEKTESKFHSAFRFSFVLLIYRGILCK